MMDSITCLTTHTLCRRDGSPPTAAVAVNELECCHRCGPLCRFRPAVGNGTWQQRRPVHGHDHMEYVSVSVCVHVCVCACAGAWSWRLVEDANEAKKCRQLSLRVDQYG